MNKLLAVPMWSAAALLSGSALAQEVSPSAADTTNADAAPQRVIVTATKREQSLKDVPISVAVVSAEQIQQSHVTDLIDLQALVPSLKVTQFNAVGQTNFIIRGFGNGAGNDGIESSVGIFIDGVYRSRSSSALDNLPDVSSIEVLRGPQSTLFGKNVSAGAIIIATTPPQFTFGGSATVEVGNYNLRMAKVAVTGPINDTVAYRLSAGGELRDGYLNNSVTGSASNNRDRSSFRGDFLIKPSSDLSVRVIADYNQITETCCGAVPLLNGPATQFIGAKPPYGLGFPIGNPANKFDNNIDFNTNPTNRLSGAGISAQVDWKTALGKITSITAYRDQKNSSFQDVDFTGSNLATKDQSSDLRTFTQELRITGGNHDNINWMVGAFVDKERLNSGQTISYGTDLRPYADGLSGTVPAALVSAVPSLAGHSNIYGLEFLQSLITPSIHPGSTYFQAGQGIKDYYSMDQTSYSLFGNLDYAVTDKLTLTAGLGYLNDRKVASSQVSLNDPFSALNLQNVPQFSALGVPSNLYGALGGLQFYYGNSPGHQPVNFPNAKEAGVLTGDKFTEALRANYDFGRTSAYASFSTGWKAGAFNLSSDSRPPDANGVGRTADPENVNLYEIGLKTTFTGGYLNLAVFNQTIKGFQSNDYNGTGYSLVNAGKESTKGLELDGAYAPVKWLRLTGSATYLDPVYNSFTQAPCVSFDAVQCPVNPKTGLTPNFRDLSGQRPAGIPKWSISTSATVAHDLGNGFNAYLRGEFDYSTPTQLDNNVPKNISTFGNRSINASLGLVNKPGKYELMFWVHNLADFRTIIAAFPTVAQSGSFSGFPNQPRTFGLTFNIKI